MIITFNHITARVYIFCAYGKYLNVFLCIERANEQQRVSIAHIFIRLFKTNNFSNNTACSLYDVCARFAIIRARRAGTQQLFSISIEFMYLNSTRIHAEIQQKCYKHTQKKPHISLSVSSFIRIYW